MKSNIKINKRWCKVIKGLETIPNREAEGSRRAGKVAALFSHPPPHTRSTQSQWLLVISALAHGPRYRRKGTSGSTVASLTGRRKAGLDDLEFTGVHSRCAWWPYLQPATASSWRTTSTSTSSRPWTWRIPRSRCCYPSSPRQTADFITTQHTRTMGQITGKK